MWESLLVLGEVPGTDHQITFEQLAALCLFITGATLIRLKRISLAQILSLRSKVKLSRFIIRYRKVYLLTKKGTQLKLPV
jgi:hypothetical protein